MNIDKKNRLPEYWVVQNDGTQLFKDIVLKYLNNKYETDWYGLSNFYGYDGNLLYRGTNARNSIKSFKNNPTLLTLEEFIELSKEKEEKLYTIKDLKEGRVAVINDGTLGELKEVIKAAFPEDALSPSGSTCYYFADNTKEWYPSDKTDLPTQSVKLFIKQIKEYMEKEIIGYKLIKPEYEEAAKAICDECVYWRRNDLYNLDAKTEKLSIPNLKNAGVLDLWFEPVYRGEEKVFKVGNFELTVKDKKVFHNDEDITDYVLSVGKWVKSIPTKFGSYDFRVQTSEIPLIKTGCQHESKVGEWMKVYDYIK